jgi:hypothetical protein
MIRHSTSLKYHPTAEKHISLQVNQMEKISCTFLALLQLNGCLDKRDSSCRSHMRGAFVWCMVFFCLSDPGSSLTSLCRSLLRAIRRLCRNSHQKISSIKPSDLGCKLPPVCNIDGSFCVDVQPFLYRTCEEYASGL